MKIVFIQYGQDITCAEMMVGSCKALGYEVIQLSDKVAPDVPGADFVLRRAKDAPSMLWRYQRLLDIPAPYIMLDTDILVAKDISEAIQKDAAVTWRPVHNVIVKDVGVVPMPYNGGFLAVNNDAFMRALVDKMEAQEPRWQEWYGDQMALRDVVAEEKFDVKILRDQAWNYVPDFLGDTTPARVLHFKGKRKSMMRPYFDALMGVES